MKREFKLYLKVTLIVYFFWFIFFEAIGWYATTLSTYDFTSFIDRQIPLIPKFVWPYILCYIFPFLPLFAVKDWHRFNRALFTIILANLSAFIVYLTLPISFPRPELGHSLSERLLSFIYRVDFYPGANKLPSLHVTFTWIVYLSCRGQRLNRLAQTVVFFLAVMITLSAVFVKQHIIIDIVAGIFWAFGSWILAGHLYRYFTYPCADAFSSLKHMIKRLAPVFFMFSIIIFSFILVRWKS